MQNAAPHAHRVAMLVYDDAQVLDVCGPLEVFGRSSRWLLQHGRCDGSAYQVELVARRAGRVRTSSGIELVAHRSYRELEPPDTLLIAGGIGYGAVARDPALLAWIREQVSTVPRVGSICTGAMVLAAAGVLHGRRATTHWSYCAELEGMIGPGRVDEDAIFVRDGHIYTSAGVTTGIDMALAMVENDWDQSVALAVAQELVLYLKRPGGQSQFSRQLAAQQVDCPVLQGLVQWIHENPGQDLRVEALASRANMSPRNFARRFREVVGSTPARYVEQVRLEHARRRLEQTGLGVQTIAARCGFGSPESMRRSFLNRLGVTPASYRDRFGRRT